MTSSQNVIMNVTSAFLREVVVWWKTFLIFFKQNEDKKLWNVKQTLNNYWLCVLTSTAILGIISLLWTLMEVIVLLTFQWLNITLINKMVSFTVETLCCLWYLGEAQFCKESVLQYTSKETPCMDKWSVTYFCDIYICCIDR